MFMVGLTFSTFSTLLYVYYYICNASYFCVKAAVFFKLCLAMYFLL